MRLQVDVHTWTLKLHESEKQIGLFDLVQRYTLNSHFQTTLIGLFSYKRVLILKHNDKFTLNISNQGNQNTVSPRKFYTGKA